MSEALKKQFTLEQYLTREAEAVYKSEYFNGQIFAMAGGTPEHSIIAVNTCSQLAQQLEDRPCTVRNSDQRVRIPATGLLTYPDISVVCGDAVMDALDPNALTNPVLIVEVLSEGTEAHDRGRKFVHYQRLTSLKQYVLISSEVCRIDLFTRAEDGKTWEFIGSSDPHGSLELSSIHCTLPLARVYAKVNVKPDPEYDSQQ